MAISEHTYLQDDDEINEILGDTPEDVNLALHYRDKVISSKSDIEQNAFCPPNADGAALLLSNYAWKGTALARLVDSIWIDKDDNGKFASHVRAIRFVPPLAAFLSGTTIAIISVPGVFNTFTRQNQITVWRTPEMAKRIAFDKVAWISTKLAVAVGIKSYFVASGLLYAPFLVSAYCGRTSYWEHGFCFGATMGLYCLPRGPMAMLVASAVAGSLGFLYGGVYYLGAKHFHYTFEELYTLR